MSVPVEKESLGRKHKLCNNSTENINTFSKRPIRLKVAHESSINSMNSFKHLKSTERVKIEKIINPKIFEQKSELPHNDKYALILENNRALKREIKNMDHDLDRKELELEMNIQSLKQMKINTDKSLVDHKFKIFKKILKYYNKCLEKINQELNPMCHVRVNFITRLENSYIDLFGKLEAFHVNEMAKYVTKINILMKKNKEFEKMFKEIKKKEQKGNGYTDIIGMKEKLDTIDKEMSISAIFQDEKDNRKARNEIICKNNEGEKKKNAISNLQEVLSTLVSVKGGNSLLQELTSDKIEFDIEGWETSMAGKLKNAQFGAAKTVMGIMTNKKKFQEMGIQTDSDPLMIMYTELRDNF